VILLVEGGKRHAAAQRELEISRVIDGQPISDRNLAHAVEYARLDRAAGDHSLRVRRDWQGAQCGDEFHHIGDVELAAPLCVSQHVGRLVCPQCRHHRRLAAGQAQQ
jgi:hypothetical protein